MSNLCAGLVICAKDSRRVADFYQNMVGLTIVQTADKFTTLEDNSFQLVVLQIPEGLAAMVSVETPPVVRENATIKPVFFVESLAVAREAAVKFGGTLNGPEWTFEDTKVCDGNDPEGNVYQLRQRQEKI